MRIRKDSVVTLVYQLFNLGVGGEETPALLEERTVDDPLDFIFGQGQLLKSAENFLDGQTAGFTGTLTLPSGEAYGAYHEDLCQWYDKSKLPKEVDLQLGMKFQTQGPDGEVMAVMVKEITDDKILLDGNHPLGGLTVEFELKVLRVRPATVEELSSKEIQQKYH